MRVVVDTNIVFSALMNADNMMGEILLNSGDGLRFYAPELLLEELDRYTEKLQKASRLSTQQLYESRTRVLASITLVSEYLISKESWRAAHALTRGVDENDTPFVALALELDARLWTGDRKLGSGLESQGRDLVVSTSTLLGLLGEG